MIKFFLFIISLVIMITLYQTDIFCQSTNQAKLNKDILSESEIPDEAYEFPTGNSDFNESYNKNIESDPQKSSSTQKRISASGSIKFDSYSSIQDKKEGINTTKKDRANPGFLNELRLKVNWDIEENLISHFEFLYQGYYGYYNSMVNYERWQALSQDDKNTVIQNGNLGSDYNQNIMIDQAYFRAYWKDFNITMGKHVIAWGAGYFANPTDKVNNKNFLNPSDQLYGTTGITFQFNLWLDTGIRGYIAVQDRSHKNYTFSEDARFQNIPYGIKFRTNIKGWDMSISYIREVFYDSYLSNYDNSHYAGLDFAGELIVGLYGEMAFKLPDDDFKPRGFNSVFTGLLGIDYIFKNGINIRLEYLRNGSGKNSKSKYDVSEVLSSERLFLGQNYLFANISKEWDLTYKIDMLGIVNLNDTSYVLRPEFSYKPFDNMEIQLGIYIMLGPKGSEFDGRLESVDSSNNPVIIDITEQLIYIKTKVNF